MAQAVTPTQIKFGYECFYRCDQCNRNVHENYQWLNLVALVNKNEQDDSKCPYCQAEIDFDLSAIDKPSNAIPPVLRFPGKDYSFVFKTDQSILTAVTIIIRGTVGKSLEINWGDRNKTITTFTGADQTIIHNYTTTGSYYISIFCDLNIITRLYINGSKLSSYLPSPNTQTTLEYLQLNSNLLSGSIPPLASLTVIKDIYFYGNSLLGSIPSLSQLIELSTLNFENNNLTGSIPSVTTNTKLFRLQLAHNNLTGSIPSLTTNTKLYLLRLHTNNLTGSIPSLTTNTKLQYFTAYVNSLSGTIPCLSTLTVLKQFHFQNNAITNYTASTLALTLTYFPGQNNQLPSSAVNQILADFVTNLASRPASGLIYLHGTGNQPPTGQGIIDKAAIIAHGWTVLTN